jgi:hypothetical protein
MTLDKLKEAINTLSREERQHLREYIEQRETPPAKKLDMDALDQIFAELREGFSEEDLDELEWAMNVEYVEPLDESEWQD